MPERPRDEEREQRITMEIIVDADGPEEQALGWYYYLENNLSFPFLARCIAERPISPLRVGDEVEGTEERVWHHGSQQVPTLSTSSRSP